MIASAGDEFIWGMDFADQSAASFVAATGARTYGQLAEISEFELRFYGVRDDELPAIKRELAKRGLKLRDN